MLIFLSVMIPYFCWNLKDYVGIILQDFFFFLRHIVFRPHFILQILRSTVKLKKYISATDASVFFIRCPIVNLYPHVLHLYICKHLPLSVSLSHHDAFSPISVSVCILKNKDILLPSQVLITKSKKISKDSVIQYTVHIISSTYLRNVLSVDRFPCYLKVEHSWETFCQLKWHKAKMQLPSRRSENPLQISFRLAKTGANRGLL